MKKRQQKVPSKFRRLVTDAVCRHLLNMDVGHYNVEVTYAKDDKSDHNGYIGAETIVNKRYLYAQLIIYPRACRNWKLKGDKYIEELIAHEIGHIVTWPLAELTLAVYKSEDEVKDAWERLTERVARLSLKLDTRLKIQRSQTTTS